MWGWKRTTGCSSATWTWISTLDQQLNVEPVFAALDRGDLIYGQSVGSCHTNPFFHEVHTMEIALIHIKRKAINPVKIYGRPRSQGD